MATLNNTNSSFSAIINIGSGSTGIANFKIPIRPQCSCSDSAYCTSTRLLTLSSQNRLMRQLLPTPSAPIEIILIRTHWGSRRAQERPYRLLVSENCVRLAFPGIRCVQQ